jgi:hypothetical protein
MIMVSTTLPNRTPESWYKNVRAGRPGYPGYAQPGGQNGSGGWITAPSGGIYNRGWTPTIPRYKTRGSGSNQGG